MWGRRPLPKRMPFKLHQASLESEPWLAQAAVTRSTLTHTAHTTGADTASVNTVLQADGSIELDHPVKFLLDSGAAIPVVRYDALPVNLWSRMESHSMATVRANGLPLDVVREITVTLTVGSFSDVHTFIIARNLTVDWLLGADILAKHGVVIDY